MMETPRAVQSPRKSSHWPAGSKVEKDLAPDGVDGGEVGAEPAPGLDAGFDGVLDVDAVLGGPDLQVLLQCDRELGDDLLAVAAWG